VFYVPTNTV